MYFLLQLGLSAALFYIALVTDIGRQNEVKFHKSKPYLVLIINSNNRLPIRPSKRGQIPKKASHIITFLLLILVVLLGYFFPGIRGTTLPVC